MNFKLENEQDPPFSCPNFQKMCRNTFWKSSIWDITECPYPKYTVCVSVLAEFLVFFGLFYFLERVQNVLSEIKTKDVKIDFALDL